MFKGGENCNLCNMPQFNNCITYILWHKSSLSCVIADSPQKSNFDATILRINFQGDLSTEKTRQNRPDKNFSLDSHGSKGLERRKSRILRNNASGRFEKYLDQLFLKLV